MEIVNGFEPTFRGVGGGGAFKKCFIIITVF